MQSFVKRNFQVRIGIVIVPHVYVHPNMWTVEMENANITNIVGMENVIMARQLKRVHKNVKNVVEMVYVVLWRIVRIVQPIVENVKCQPLVEIIFVKWEKHVIHVRVIVDVIQTAAMVPARIRLEKHAKLVQEIVERVHHPQNLIVVMEPVMQMKNVTHVHKIVESVPIFVATVTAIRTKHVIHVQPIVGSALLVHRQVRVQVLNRLHQLLQVQALELVPIHL